MAKKKVMSIPEKTKEVKLIPEDLQNQMKAIQACATAFNLIEKGTYAYPQLEAVRASLAFLAKLHEQSMDKALAHPQAHMIEDPEFKSHLKELKEKSKPKKAVKNVEAQQAEQH